MRLMPFALLLLMAPAGAPQAPQNTFPPNPPSVKFSTNTQLVVEIVSVKNKNGNAVEGLTAKDFTVTENGIAQTISFCEFQGLQDTPLPSLAPAAAPAATPAAPEVKPVTAIQIAAESSGDIRYKDRRLLVVYFDMTAMPVPDQLRALAAARKFIRTQMAPADLMAIMKFATGSVQVLEDFTNDRDELEKAIQTMIVGEGQGFDENA